MVAAVGRTCDASLPSIEVGSETLAVLSGDQLVGMGAWLIRGAGVKDAHDLASLPIGSPTTILGKAPSDVVMRLREGGEKGSEAECAAPLEGKARSIFPTAPPCR